VTCDDALSVQCRRGMGQLTLSVQGGVACETCDCFFTRFPCLRDPSILTVPAWHRGRRTIARGLAKSSSRTPRTQRRALPVDRFGPERTQRTEVLARKTGRQSKFCRTSVKTSFDAPRHATKFIVLHPLLQQITAFPLSRHGWRGAEPTPRLAAGSLGKSKAMPKTRAGPRVGVPSCQRETR
jgi:hypothetical protein